MLLVYPQGFTSFTQGKGWLKPSYSSTAVCWFSSSDLGVTNIDVPLDTRRGRGVFRCATIYSITVVFVV